ncbi:MAG: NEAT domain-containing protein [Lachnospiraceae bacterium]|nr:NEAT domain-containing protein [Lachnospiraceae bacterium]
METKRLSRTQMNYLRTWLSQDESNRSMANAALKLHVSRAAVQKILNTIREQGFLGEKYELTKQGEDYYGWYNLRYQSIVKWFKLNDISEEEAMETANLLIAEAPLSVSEMLMNKSVVCNICHMRAFEPEDTDQKIELTGEKLSEFLAEGIYTVNVEFRKVKNETELSMADKAFEKPGKLLISANRGYILLRRKKISYISNILQRAVSGKMRSLEYCVHDRTRSPRVENDVVRIPVRDILWSCSGPGGVLTGRLQMAFTCTVGSMHMPKAEAVMCIKITDQKLA